MARGRRQHRHAAPTGHATPSQAAAAVLAQEPARLAWMRVQGERIAAGAAPATHGRFGGAAGDAELGAGDLVEAALWVAEGGDRVRAEQLLDQAATHQRAHIRLLIDAMERPATKRHFWRERHRLGAGTGDRASRGLVRDDASRWLGLIGQLRADPGHLGSGPSVGHARAGRARRARSEVMRGAVAAALREGRASDARELAAAVHTANGDPELERLVRGLGHVEMLAAAGLERAKAIYAEENLPVVVGETLLGGRSGEDLLHAYQSTLGPRRIGPRAPGGRSAPDCRHQGARWVAEGPLGDQAPDTLCLVCEACASRLAAVPAHRLPESCEGIPAAAGLLGEVRGGGEAYVRRERRYRALAGEPVPPATVTIDQLREADGVADLAALAAAATRTPERRRARNLAQALAGRPPS